jgi:DNA adenine methylase
MLLTQKTLFDDRPDASVARNVVNVSSVPQRSPFRYPGGKTWFVPDLRRWFLGINKPKLLIEPFAGGAISGLTAAFEGLADHVLLVEKDPMVASVWRTILGGDAEWLADRILRFELSIQSIESTLAYEDVTPREEGFRTLLRNRINHGGRLSSGSGMLKNGEAGKGIASRWYPETLAKRIMAIDSVRSKLTLIEGDGIDVIDEHKMQKSTAFFIDPPYTAGTGGKRAGKRLYTYNELDHDRLFSLVSSVKGEFLMTYDDDIEVMAMAKNKGFKVCKVPMRGTHHREILELVILPSESTFS